MSHTWFPNKQDIINACNKAEEWIIKEIIKGENCFLDSFIEKENNQWLGKKNLNRDDALLLIKNQGEFYNIEEIRNWYKEDLIKIKNLRLLAKHGDNLYVDAVDFALIYKFYERVK